MNEKTKSDTQVAAAESPLTLADRCRRVELLLLDVDGVLTEGGIAYIGRRPIVLAPPPAHAVPLRGLRGPAPREVPLGPALLIGSEDSASSLAGPPAAGGATSGREEAAVEWKQFHVRDGSALKIWQQAGKRVALLSGRAARVVEVRAAELGITTVVQGASSKVSAFATLLDGQGLSAEQVAFVGDDQADVPVLCRCGLAVAVADACPEALWVAHHVTRRPGGRGAVREVIERILRCQGLWPQGDKVTR
jgi:3-deoxy-D-manno-octulosonate 8-phosphate phosphatase (KDO 8-P phosphatase)